MFTNKMKYLAFAVNSYSKLIIKVVEKEHNICLKLKLMTPKGHAPCMKHHLQCYLIVN